MIAFSGGHLSTITHLHDSELKMIDNSDNLQHFIAKLINHSSASLLNLQFAYDFVGRICGESWMPTPAKLRSQD